MREGRFRWSDDGNTCIEKNRKERKRNDKAKRCVRQWEGPDQRYKRINKELEKSGRNIKR